MRAQFYAGPWDGEWRDVRDGATEIRVPLCHVVSHVTREDVPEWYGPSIRFGLYRRVGAMRRFVWREPAA